MSKASRIQIVLKTNELTVVEATEMWQLYEPYYHYSFEEFFGRIPKNTHYALYRRAGKLVGFTGLRLEKLEFAASRYFTIYFGQTIVAPGVRGKGLINRTGIRLFRRFWRDFLFRRVIFWADALSCRAYLVFAKNLKDYYPNPQARLPEDLKQLRNTLGSRHYGDRYCADLGIVYKDQYLIRDSTVVVRAEQKLDPDVRCFVTHNPGYTTGTGLLTMGPGHWQNLRFMLRKAWLKKRSLRQSSPSVKRHGDLLPSRSELA